MSSNKDIIHQDVYQNIGSRHPINNMKSSIMSLLSSFGFKIIDGPEIETEEYNFDMLNIKESHPARQMILFMFKINHLFYELTPHQFRLELC